MSVSRLSILLSVAEIDELIMLKTEPSQVMMWLGFHVHLSSLGRRPTFSKSEWTCKLAILGRRNVAPAPKPSSRETTIAVVSLRQFLTKG